MGVRLSVPVVSQALDMSCWYASACMVAYYRAAGPRRGLPEEWSANEGLTYGDLIRLANSEGFRAIMTPAGALTAQQLEIFLRNNGPILCVGTWFGFHHAIVLTGVWGDQVYFNDPAGGRRKTGTIAWFNQKLTRRTNTLMYMPA